MSKISNVKVDLNRPNCVDADERQGKMSRDGVRSAEIMRQTSGIDQKLIFGDHRPSRIKIYKKAYFIINHSDDWGFFQSTRSTAGFSFKWYKNGTFLFKNKLVSAPLVLTKKNFF